MTETVTEVYGYRDKEILGSQLLSNDIYQFAGENFSQSSMFVQRSDVTVLSVPFETSAVDTIRPSSSAAVHTPPLHCGAPAKHNNYRPLACYLETN